MTKPAKQQVDKRVYRQAALQLYRQVRYSAEEQVHLVRWPVWEQVWTRVHRSLRQHRETQ